MNKHILLTLFATILMLSACSSTKDEATADASSAAGDSRSASDDPRAERPAVKIYNDGLLALKEKRYSEAIINFEEVERQHPYSEYATDAQLLAGRAAYEGKKYDEAIISFDRFIELHPGSDTIDYAYYLRALCFYEQISDVRRDQAMTQEALKALNSLIKRFPSSKYTRDAQLKRDLTLDHLAGKEMEIGRYYLTRGHISASLNRFQNVIRNYQTTTHIPEALYRLVEAYLSLGIPQEAYRVATILGHNYPGSEWYDRAYKLLDPELREQLLAERSWVDKTVDVLLKPD